MVKNHALLRFASLASASAAAAIAASPVAAQTVIPPTPEVSEGAVDEPVAPIDIVVTARKREERLLDVPISITAFSAADIERKQIVDMRDVASLAPNVTFQDIGGRNTPALFIRGIVNTATVGRLATTAVFQDGIYVLGGVGSVNTADAERIEVIKGPQNAYFGRNTFAGAINFITRQPGDEFAGSISAEGTARGSYDFTASLEGPLILDKLSFRVLANTRRKAAMYTASDGGKIGREDTRQISATLFATPTERLSLRIRADYQHNDDGPPQTAYLRGTQYGNDCSGTTIRGGDLAGNQRDFAVTLPYFCGSIPGLDQLGNGVVTSNTSFASSFWTALSGNPNIIRDTFVNNSLNAKYVGRAPDIDHFGLVRDQWRLSGSANWDLSDDVSTVLNLGYNKNDTIVIQDSDRTDQQNVYAILPALYQDFSAELRVQSSGGGRLRWMLGGNYYKSSTDANGSGDVTFQVRFSPTSPQTTTGVLFSPQNANGERANVWAVFGSAEFDILRWLTLSGELRYQTDRSKTSPDQATSAFATFKDWLPRVILKVQPTPDWSSYITWSRGVLPGQFNTQYITATPAVRR